MLSRFFVENLAAQGYLDISYVALIVWAVALEVERPRRGAPVFLLLAAAGLLRPDAWVLSGVYWLWCAWPQRAHGRDRHARLAYLGAGGDRAAGVGRRSTRSSPATRCTRCTRPPAWPRNSDARRGSRACVASVWTYSVRIDKLPVVLGGLIGVPLAVWLAPRRVLVPLAVLVLLVFVFVAEGAAGASVIDRYLMGAGGGAARLLRGRDRRLVDARARLEAAPRVDGRRPRRWCSTARCPPRRR